MINVTAAEAINKANYFINNGYHYIYGMKESYNPVTANRIASLAKDNPKVFTQSYILTASTFINGRAIDCSGLVCQCLGISDIGSYSIESLPDNRPSDFKYVDLSERKPGDVLWKNGHVGIVVDKTSVIEARSIAAGVKRFSYTSQKWVKCIRPFYKPEKDYEKGWHKDDKGWWYAYGEKKGEYYKKGIYNIGGENFIFDEEGYCLKALVLLTNDRGNVDTTFSKRLE